MADQISAPARCVICDECYCDCRWLRRLDAYEFRCPTCGRYSLDTALWQMFERARESRFSPVTRLLRGLQRAIAVSVSVPHFDRHNWEAEARDHLEEDQD